MLRLKFLKPVLAREADPKRGGKVVMMMMMMMMMMTMMNPYFRNGGS